MRGQPAEGWQGQGQQRGGRGALVTGSCMGEGQRALALPAWRVLKEEALVPAASQVLWFTRHTGSDSAHPRTGRAAKESHEPTP